MDPSHTHIEIRRPWRAGETIFLLGPGGVGKSTLGRELSQLQGWQLIDLDLEFCDRIEIIGDFIATQGTSVIGPRTLHWRKSWRDRRGGLWCS